MTLFEKLSRYSSSGALPMHMPGHKRNIAAFPWLAGLGELDITEIAGFDNLNDPEGLFSDMEKKIARIWGATESIALVNGSTVGVLAAVMSALDEGGELLMFRDSHRSVYHAAQLAGAVTRYLTPEADPELGLPLSVTPEDVAEALEKYPRIKLVCVTSPTYDGVISDIAGIADVCHSRGIPLFVDEAHGAHLGFGDFPASAVRSGADMAVQSLHKTLPSLTQTAVLHINTGLVDSKKVRRYVAMLQTSSPSYLLSASIDMCADFLAREGGKAVRSWFDALEDFRDAAEKLERIRLWTPDTYSYDPSKLVLRCDGKWLEKRLREDFGIEVEYSSPTHVLCMTGMGDTSESLSRLLDALTALDSAAPAAPPPCPAGGLPEQVMPVHEAVKLPGESVPPDAALGRVCGEYIWAYPPGVPIIVPGEIVNEDVLRSLKGGFDLHSSAKGVPNSIFCVDLTRKI